MKAQRAWNNKLKRIDQLIAWLYSADILNKTDKDSKDRLFRKYYRWYNDGDIPRGMNPGGYSAQHLPKNIHAEISERLEKQLEEFICFILKKYKGKYSRRMFHIDNAISKNATVISVCENNDYHGLCTYWKRDVQSPSTLAKIEELAELGKKFKQIVPERLKSYTFSHTMSSLTAEEKSLELLEISRVIKIKMVMIATDLKTLQINLEMKKELCALGK